MEDLTLDQKNVIRLVAEENLMVVGGPGTGKSILALYAMEKILRQHRRVLLLAFNRNLENYLTMGAQMIKESRGSSHIKNIHLNHNIKTFDSWFGKLIIKYIGFQKGRDYHSIKYKLMQEFIDKGQYKIEYDTIILDEAQDLPEVAHRYLSKVCRQVILFCDLNQSILNKEKMSRIIDIKKSYQNYTNVYYIMDNYRNTKQIFDLARVFNKHEEIEVTYPKSVGMLPTLIHRETNEEVTKAIAKLIDKRKRQTFGVFIPTYKDEYKDFFITLYTDIKKRTIFKNKDNESRFSYSLSGDKTNLSFIGNYVHFTTFNTMKGLEYDVVVIPTLNCKFFENETEENLAKTYVAITRAKKEFYAFYQDEINSFFLKYAFENKNKITINEAKKEGDQQ